MSTSVTRGPNPMLEWRYQLSDTMAILGSRYGWPMLQVGESLTPITDPSRFGAKPETKAKFAAWCRAFESTPS